MEQHLEQIPATSSYNEGVGKRNLARVWKAVIFLLVYEAWERMAWLLMASSSVNNQIRSGMGETPKIATWSFKNWVVVSYITSILGGYLADAYLGFFRTIWIFSSISILGFLMMTIAASTPSLNQSRPPSDCNESSCLGHPKTFQVVFWYVALYLLALGTGGLWPAVPAFGADQFDDKSLSEQISRNSFFNWFFFSVALGSLFSWTLQLYADNHISARLQLGFPTIIMSVALAVFLSGGLLYRYKRAKGQPLTRLAQVVVAAVRKRKVALPLDQSRLYEDCGIGDHGVAWNEATTTPAQPCSRRLYHTRGFRCLDKAAVIGSVRMDGAARIPASRWYLCPVTQVEDLKLVLRIAPIWFGTLMFNIVKAQVQTLFAQQGQIMDKRIGPSMRISADFMQTITYIVIVLIIPGYELILVSWVRRFTNNERGFSLLQRMGIGMLFSILSMVAAALTEMEHRKHDSLSILWLCPQYVLEGLGEVFTSVGQLEFVYDQAPDSMRGMAAALYFTNYGVAVLLSSLLSTIVNVVTGRDNRPGWLGTSYMDRRRLDLYYWLLAVLGSVNLVFYTIFARIYKYKKVDRREISKDSRSFEWNVSQLGLMQKPTLFKHISTLNAVKEEDDIFDESPQRTSYYTSESSPLGDDNSQSCHDYKS